MEEIVNIKRTFLSAVIRLAILATVLMVPVAMYMKLYLVCISQLILVAGFITADYYVRWKLDNFTLASVLSLGLAFLATALVAILGDRDIFFWFLLFPPASMFALGVKIGLRWNIFSLPAIFFLLVNQIISQKLPYTSAIVIFSSYTSLFLISYFLEKARQTIENKLETTTMTDFLTNAKNRRGFDHELRLLIESSRRHYQPFCLLFIDLDHFKAVNDRYGHDIGDEVLIVFTKLIQESLRINDEAFRTGGEEFAIILPQTEISGGRTFAERLRQSIKTFEFPCIKTITASMGLVQFYPDTKRDDLLKGADKMLYLAKDSGRDRIESEKFLAETA
ncbi:MAG: GGDEF domain-containing protein [Spirochaetia bacterium]|nr:GGDEF domain-containing protein [Spirochaetia bacterium]